jgi:FKBP-type peptidyl-prolyl cis-trans isomerase (trigger factor)
VLALEGRVRQTFKTVTTEVATYVAQETQKIEEELRLLTRVETTKPDYDAFVAEFEEQLRQMMRELATPAGRVEEDSGIQEIVMGHGIQLSSAEMEARISNQLVSLPMSRFEKFAMVKIAENIPQNPGKKCVSCGLFNNPGVLVCVQCQTKIIGAMNILSKPSNHQT